jgi:hypothetical protein
LDCEFSVQIFSVLQYYSKLKIAYANVSYNLVHYEIVDDMSEMYLNLNLDNIIKLENLSKQFDADFLKCLYFVRLFSGLHKIEC